MPLHPGHSDEIREKNIKEMIDAGHEPKQAVAAAYANQRKYKKMAEGGMVHDDSAIEQEEIEGQTSDPHLGLFELQEASHLDEHLDEVPEHHEPLAHALGKRENYDVNNGSGDIGDKETPDEVVALPASHYAEEAKKIVMKRRKQKLIDTTKK